jgi:hypothetical protein
MEWLEKFRFSRKSLNKKNILVERFKNMEKKGMALLKIKRKSSCRCYRLWD